MLTRLINKTLLGNISSIRMISSTQNKKSILVVGGNGALGKSVIDTFNAAGWTTVSSDIVENASASKSVIIPEGAPIFEQEEKLVSSFKDLPKFDAIICTAGGWAGGNAGSDTFLHSVVRMQSVCLDPAIITASVASKHLHPGGYVALTGSVAGLHPTPTMIGYGISKCATHFLAKSLAAPESGLPEKSSVVCMLPITIDTPSNRQWMAGPGVDVGTWTPPAHIAEFLLKWCSGKSTEIASGSLVVAKTAAGNTKFELV